MDDQITTQSTESTSSPSAQQSGGGGSRGAASVQLKQSLRGMGYEAQAEQLTPAGGSADGVQMMRRPGAVQRSPARGEGGGASVVQRRSVQRVEPPTPTVENTPTVTPGAEGGAQVDAPVVEDLWDRASIMQWRQTFEIQIGNSLVAGATATATGMARQVMSYMEQRHGSLKPEAEGYRASVKAIGQALGKPDLDSKDTVWGGGVRPEDFEALMDELKTDKTTSFGLRERLFACQMWYEKALTPDLVESHAKVQEYAQKAGMAVANINTFWTTARTTFLAARQADEEAGNAEGANKPMEAWNDLAGMNSDPRLVEQNNTRDFTGGGTQARSDMTVKAFTDLGGVLSGYELQKLIRLDGREAEFKALVDGGMTAEAALQQMIAGGLGDAVLPWNEGARTFKTKVDALVAEEAPNMPQMAGTSGTTARMMEVGSMLGVSGPDMLKAMLGMLLPIRAHSFQEVVRGSGQAHTFAGTVDDYTSVVPGCGSLDQTNFDKAKRSEAALANSGGAQ